MKSPNYTAWFKKRIIEPQLKGYFELTLPGLSAIIFDPEVKNCLHYDCRDEIQYLDIKYLSPIAPDQVDFEFREKIRIEKIKNWANSDTLNRVFVDDNFQAITKHLPILYREIDLSQSNYPKFQITNGCHRFYFAAKQKIGTILSMVEERFIIQEIWVRSKLEEYVIMKKNDQEKGLHLLSIKL